MLDYPPPFIKALEKTIIIKIWSQRFLDWRQKALKLTPQLESKQPKAYIKHINGYGKVQIGFTQNIWRVLDLVMINNGTIFMSDLDFLEDWFHRRLLPNQDVPVLELAMIPGAGQQN